MGKLFFKDLKLPGRLLCHDFLRLVNNQVDNVVPRLPSPAYSDDVDIPLDQHLPLRVVHGGVDSVRDPFHAVQSPVYVQSFGRNKGRVCQEFP